MKRYTAVVEHSPGLLQVLGEGDTPNEALAPLTSHLERTIGAKVPDSLRMLLNASAQITEDEMWVMYDHDPFIHSLFRMAFNLGYERHRQDTEEPSS